MILAPLNVLQTKQVINLKKKIDYSMMKMMIPFSYW